MESFPGYALYDAGGGQIRAGLAKDMPQGWQVKADILDQRPPTGGSSRTAHAYVSSSSVFG